MSKVVIVGAGQAGSEAATHLRGQGFDGEITLIGAENVLPYQPHHYQKNMLSVI